MLAENRDQVSVVDDQFGNPTSAFDIADGILAVAMNLLGSDAPELRGIFHMAGAGYASWADFAAEIFAQLARLGGMSVLVDRISAAEYPTLAKRPANSRLDCSKLASAHGVVLPEWRTATATVLKKILIKDSVKRSAIEEQY
jgi:dTDP-4-dehydrorhamnose reductase